MKHFLLAAFIFAGTKTFAQTAGERPAPYSPVSGKENSPAPRQLTDSSLTSSKQTGITPAVSNNQKQMNTLNTLPSDAPAGALPPKPAAAVAP